MTTGNVAEAPHIPLGTPHSAAIAHARRISHLIREVSATGWRAGYGDLIALGIAFSEAADLAIIGTPADIDWQAVAAIAFPAGRKTPAGRDRLAEALWLDVPRYVGPFRSGCPGTAPRGGVCRGKRVEVAPWVTNESTGDHERREICAKHLPTARWRLVNAPEPRVNSGGILERVFDEYDMDPTYRAVMPTWEPAEESAPAPRVKLQLLVGGGR